MKIISHIFILVVAFQILPTDISAQGSDSARFSAGADLYTSYIWRGTRYGSGPSVQPWIKFTAGPFSAGCWGSFDFNGYQEADLWLSVRLPAGFSIGLTDYYYPVLDYFDYSKLTGSHAFEINTGYSWRGLSLAANYIINTAGGAGSAGNDKYFQAQYSFSSFSVLIGAGDGWHTSGQHRFNVCNVGLGTTREIKVTGSFTIPVTGHIILNPERERLYVVAGFSF